MNIEADEIHVKLIIPESQQFFSRAELKDIVCNVVEQAYREGMAKAMEVMATGSPPRTNH